MLRVAHGSFEQWQNTPVQVRTSVILTLTRKLTTTAIPAMQAKAPVMARWDGSCQFFFGDCKAPFRTPGVFVFFSGNARIPWVSYSPFPAEVGINPMDSESTGFLRLNPQQGLAITTEEPVAHLHGKTSLSTTSC